MQTLLFFTICSIFLYAADRISILLREMNAKNFHQISTPRQNIQIEMFKFTDKLISVLGERCMCCRIRGFTDCPLRGSSPQPGTFLFSHAHLYQPYFSVDFPPLLSLKPCCTCLPDSVDQARTPIGCKIAGKVLDMSAGSFHPNFHIHPNFSNLRLLSLMAILFLVPHLLTCPDPCVAASASPKGKWPISPDNVPN
jgi:hypothetical protein